MTKGTLGESSVLTYYATVYQYHSVDSMCSGYSVEYGEIAMPNSSIAIATGLDEPGPRTINWASNNTDMNEAVVQT